MFQEKLFFSIIRDGILLVSLVKLLILGKGKITVVCSKVWDHLSIKMIIERVSSWLGAQIMSRRAAGNHFNIIEGRQIVGKAIFRLPCLWVW